MKYEHYMITKTGVRSWLQEWDLDHMANENGWLLISIVQIDDVTLRYIFRREVKD